MKHGDSGKPTWANERICYCGETYRTMPPGPSLADHIREKEEVTEPATVTVEEMLDILARHGMPEEKIGTRLRRALEEVVAEQAGAE